MRYMTALFTALTLVISGGAFAGSDAAKAVSQNFTSVAKSAIPAVVSIHVENKESFDGSRLEMEEPFNFFQDDFFDQFFRMRRRRFPAPEQRPAIGQASGFAISEEGYILTNNHVVRNAGKIIVRLDEGEEFEAQLIGQDPHTDLAVIKIEANNLPHLKLGDSDNLDVGEWVVAIGNPLGLQASLTVGVVSAKGRNNLDLANIEDFIQTDAAINRGNSGGPLINLNGEVVGINTAIVSNMGGGGYMGIGFAIPSNMAIRVVEQLIQNGSFTRGFIGVSLQNIDKNLAEAFKLPRPEGALIAEVIKDSPADKGGIRQGDVIVEYDGKPVKNGAALRNTIALQGPQSKSRLVVHRDGEQKTLEITVGSYEEKKKNGGINAQKFGVEVEDSSSEEGVVITDVKAGSAAFYAGLNRGARIVSVNRKKIGSKNEFRKILEQADPKKPVLFLVVDKGVSRYTMIQVP